MKDKQIQSYDIPLHDIKTIVDVEEYSFYYFLATVGIGLVILFGIFYLFYLWYKKRNSFNIRKENFKILNNLDLTNTKKSAYDMTFYGATFKDDSDRHKQMYENLINRLEVYKYKKEVESFDSEVLGYIDLYKGMIDV